MSNSAKNAPIEGEAEEPRAALKSKLAKIRNESNEPKLRSHIPKLFYCLNGHLKNIVDTAIRKTAMTSYHPQKVKTFSESLSIEISLSLKERAQAERYRTVVFVTMMQKNEQIACCRMGFIWDATQDHWNHYVFDCRAFQLTACVLCVYLD